jgi:ComF family protein
MCTAAGRAPSRAARFFSAALDLIFPSRCLACGARLVEDVRAGGVCRACWRDLPVLSGERCSVCAEPISGAVDELPCGRCLADPPPFALLTAAAPYAGSAREILVAFKFRGADYLARHLARRLAERCRGENEALPFDEVVPVPSGSLSRWRRDHAARTLAEHVAREIHAPLSARRLFKRRRTRRQSGLPAARRAGNVRGAFAARAVAPARVLLVDDVATSGATARECARALVRAGARHVEVWTFARAGREREGARGPAETAR